MSIMETNTFGDKLLSIYLRALKDIELLSGVLIEDEDNADPSVELLLTEAMYSIACYSRAVRQTNSGLALKDKATALKNNLNESFRLMSEDEISRLKSYMRDYFSLERIKDRGDSLKDKFESAFNSKNLYKLIEDEETEDQVFDFFLFRDRYACFIHHEDCPVPGLKSTLAECKDTVDYIYSKLKAIFNIYSKSIIAYRSNTFIPNEPAYSFWHEIPEVSAEEFSASYEKTASCVYTRKAFHLLLKTCSSDLTEKVNQLNIDNKISDIINNLGSLANETFKAVSAAVPRIPQPAPEPAWDNAENKIGLILSQNHEGLQNEAVRMSKCLDKKEQRDILILQYLLAGDEDNIIKLL